MGRKGYKRGKSYWKEEFGEEASKLRDLLDRLGEERAQREANPTSHAEQEGERRRGGADESKDSPSRTER